jgi:mannose-6-phosphate isomerase-like protein (cupin superfamily)
MKRFMTASCLILLSIATGSRPGGAHDTQTPGTDGDAAPVRLWQVFDLDELGTSGENQRFREFLNVPSMTAGLYVLAANAADDQSAHERDELYHVISGRATLLVGQAEHPVGPGSVVFVRRGVEHRFQGITEELRVLVLFAGDKR